jgi:hypothetical protein
MNSKRWVAGLLAFSSGFFFIAGFLPAETIAAESAAQSASCPLDPGLAQVRQACDKDRTPLECPYLESATALLRNAPDRSAAILAESLARLDAENLSWLIPRLQLLSFALAAPGVDGGCLAAVTPLMLELTAAALESQPESPAGLLFLSPLIYPLRQDDLQALESKAQSAAAEVRLAREAFAKLLDRTAAGKQVRRGASLVVALELLQKKALSPIS